MRFSTYINNQKAIEWGLNANQAALFDLLNQAVSWAEEIIVDGVVYYWVSRNKVLEELPLFYKTSDTVYRHFSDLDEKGLIIYLKQGKHGDKDLIRLTEKGKSWNEFKPEQIRDNSEINPSLGDELGNKSEITRKQIRDNSEINPTNNNTNYKNTNNHNNSTSGKNFPPVKTGKKFVYTDDDLRAANWIFVLIKNLSPNVKTPNFASWANEIRLMRERDGRTHKDICELFKWANEDEFWSANILSPSKLRDKWDQLEIKKRSCKAVKRKESFADKNSSDWSSPEKMAEAF
nr:MAG TPA: replication protein O [Caudoviricetes sp.]